MTMGKETKNENHYSFLNGYEGKIAVVRGTEKIDGTVIIPQWVNEREKHLFNGKISNQNLREKLPTEIDLELDHNEGADFFEARKEADDWVNKIRDEMIKRNVYFYITDHKGKSPHIRLFIEGLEHNPLRYVSEYKLRLVTNLLEAIKFKPKLVQLDVGLITSHRKLISLEGVPHWKEKWNGEPEKIIFENIKGKKPTVKTEIMETIITDLNRSYKIDNKEISSEPINVEDVNMVALKELWKINYVEGKKNILVVALGGLCVRKGLEEKEANNILKQLLAYVGLPNHYERASNELSYSFEQKKEDVAVLFHLKKVFNEEEANNIYRLLKNCFMSNKELNYVNIRLSQLNASHIDKNVSVNCQITGEQSQKAVPKEIIIRCETCGGAKIFSSLINPEIFCGDRLLKAIIEDLKKQLYCDCKPKPYKTCQINDYTDHSVLYVRDLLIKEETFTQKKYDPKKVYVVGKELPKTKIINIKGKVIIEPKTKDISIIATEVEPLKNQVEDFQITEEMKQDFKKYFKGSDLSEEINPDTVGQKRKIAKQCVIAQLHSPCQIWNIERKKIIRGGLNLIFLGDTKVSKSEIAKDVTSKGYFEVGEYVVAETGGRTGFLYTIDNDNKALIWGTLPLNDMGLVVIDGLQSIHTEEMGEFREALELQEIIVNRSLKGSALARTRIIACMNPFKPMNNYIRKCEAISDNYVFKNTPDITRWDLFIPFCQKDVSSEEISQRTYKDRNIPKNVFINHVFWVWSRKPNQIEYTVPAVQEIKNKSQEMINEYALESLPIVHNGIRDILTRLAVSKACELHSTDGTHEKVIIEKDHVVKCVDFYKDVLNLLELKEYKREIDGKAELTQADKINIAKDLGDMEYKILDQIKHGSKSSTELSGVLSVSDRTVKEYYGKLKGHELIETKQGQGIGLSVKGVNFVRWVLQGGSMGIDPKKEEKQAKISEGGIQVGSEIGKKTFTNKNDSEGILHHFTGKEKGGMPKNPENPEASDPLEVEEETVKELPKQPVFTVLEREESGICSYCGYDTLLIWKDQNGHFACDVCARGYK